MNHTPGKNFGIRIVLGLIAVILLLSGRLAAGNEHDPVISNDVILYKGHKLHPVETLKEGKSLDELIELDHAWIKIDHSPDNRWTLISLQSIQYSELWLVNNSPDGRATPLGRHGGRSYSIIWHSQSVVELNFPIISHDKNGLFVDLNDVKQVHFVRNLLGASPEKRIYIVESPELRPVAVEVHDLFNGTLLKKIELHDDRIRPALRPGSITNSTATVHGYNSELSRWEKITLDLGD